MILHLGFSRLLSFTLSRLVRWRAAPFPLLDLSAC